MKISELREKPKKELLRLLETSREELAQLKFSVAHKEQKDVTQLKKKRKEIARLLTVLGEVKIVGERR